MRRPLERRALIMGLALLIAACTGTIAEDPPPAEDPGELLVSELSRDRNPVVSESDRSQLSSDNRAFAFDLLGQIRQEESGNIFCSPHSISIALAMTYAGASDQTYEEMGELLRFTLDEEILHPAFNALDLELAQRSEVEVNSGDPPQLNVVNAIWGQKEYPFTSSFLDTLAINYGAGLRAVDFRNEPDVVREQINQWVEDQTNDRIKDLLPQGSITPLTRLVLTNAIYFLAGWDSDFPKSRTSDQPFTRPDGSTVSAPLMEQEGSFRYHIGDETLAISLPYVGRQLSMIAFMPADPSDFEAWELALDLDVFDGIVSELEVGTGTIALPKFGSEGDYDLKKLFEAMGWTHFAGLSRMAEGMPLEITDILHKSFIKVDEEGTEAAAATAVIIGEDASIGPEDDFNLRFDRAFYFAIYDKPTDTILFLGRVADPRAD